MGQGLTMAAVAAALGAGAAGAQEAPLEVVATVGMLADVAREVGGECAEVTALMGPGVDPHLFQPSAGDVRALGGADIILYAGLSLEGQLGEVLERFAETKPTLAVAEAAVPEEDRLAPAGAEAEGGGAYAWDPHVWMDASLWARAAEPIAEALAEARPACADGFAERAAAYRDQLLALHDWAAESVATIPEGARVLVTAHDAFAYYGRAYGIEVEGVQGISTEAEAGVADIRAMADLVAERGVPAVFVESTINPRTVQAVIDAAAERGQPVALGGELLSDALGAEGTPEGTYIGMIHANTSRIVEALGGMPAPLPETLAPWAERWDLAEAP